MEAEAWLEDKLEGLCPGLFRYRVHRDRGPGITRFAPEPTSTAQSIRQLEARGVEVRLDQPSSLLDTPSVEIGQLHRDCEWLLGEFGPEIERWFNKRRAQMPLVVNFIVI